MRSSHGSGALLLSVLVLAGCASESARRPAPQWPPELADRPPAAQQAPPSPALAGTEWPRNVVPYKSCPRTSPIGSQRAGVGVIASTCRLPGSQQQGAFVFSLRAVKGIPSAAEGKLRPKDQIVAVNRCQIDSAAQLVEELRRLPPSFEAEFLVVRDGERLPPVRIKTIPWVEEFPEENARRRRESDDASKCTDLGLVPVR